MIELNTIERALQAWVVGASGLSDGQVFWSRQNGRRPNPPYIVLRTMAIKTIGQDWLDRADVEDPDPGAELEFRLRGMRELTVTLQAFAGSAAGEQSPEARLEAVAARSRLPSAQDLLDAGQVSVARIGPVMSLDAALGSVIEPRAVLEIRCFAVSEVTEFATIIETLEVTDLSTGDVYTVP